MKCEQAVYHQPIAVIFFPVYNLMIEFSYFQNTISLTSLYWIKFIVEERVFYFSTKT